MSFSHQPYQEYPGDTWQHQPPPAPIPNTRAQEQTKVDLDYGEGRISLADWLEKTTDLSDPDKWAATGRVPADGK
jgi:hypothetical protein